MQHNELYDEFISPQFGFRPFIAVDFNWISKTVDTPEPHPSMEFIRHRSARFLVVPPGRGPFAQVNFLGLNMMIIHQRVSPLSRCTDFIDPAHCFL